MMLYNQAGDLQKEQGLKMYITFVQAYSPLGKAQRQVLEDKTVSNVAQRRARSNAQVNHQLGVLHPMIMSAKWLRCVSLHSAMP